MGLERLSHDLGHLQLLRRTIRQPGEATPVGAEGEVGPERLGRARELDGLRIARHRDHDAIP